jgi:hypothetical protein
MLPIIEKIRRLTNTSIEPRSRIRGYQDSIRRMLGTILVNWAKGNLSMPKVNENLKSTVPEIVDNQLRDNTPPETRQTYQRLLKEGYKDQEARELIGVVVSSEIFL